MALAATTSAWLRAWLSHLGVDAVAEADRQRHAERDQRQQQDVGQRQQEGPAQAYGASPSGAAKRKPTPRTVSM